MIDIKNAMDKLMKAVAEWVDENPDTYKKLRYNHLQSTDTESIKNKL